MCMNVSLMIEKTRQGELDEMLEKLYGENAVPRQRERYLGIMDGFLKNYGDLDCSIFSVPGRSEICGNHTDHNYGKVVAAAIDLDVVAVASKMGGSKIKLYSVGYGEINADAFNRDPDSVRNGSPESVITGMCSVMEDYGRKVGAFYAYASSDVLRGSGLSSSAAFEVLVGTIENYFYNDGAVSAVEIAKASQKAENIFFGKPCGLMDQTACAVGGFITIDFADPKDPVVRKFEKTLSDYGYSLCIVDTGGNHADLTPDYASVPAEMKTVARLMGKDVLREVDEAEFVENIPVLREKAGDRAVLRAIHFFNENKRVDNIVSAFDEGNIEKFFEVILASGSSSFKYLQNVYTTANVREQGLSLALALSEGEVSRVHGGGFAGTIQAFVKNENVDVYKKKMDAVFGEDKCRVLSVRFYGACKVDFDKIIG